MSTSFSYNTKHSIYLCLLLTSLTTVSNRTAFAAPYSLPETFPIPMTFHSTDRLNVHNPAFNSELEKNSAFPIIAGLGNTFSKDKIKIAKTKWREKLVITGDAYGGVGEKDFSEVWPGHVLYKVGTLLINDISPQDTLLIVEDHKTIAANNKVIERNNKTSPFTLTLYAIDKQGKPDWSHAEYITVESVNPAKHQFIVKRGQWGTKPLAFKSGKAVLASRMMYWSGQWQLNLSLHSPRGGKDNLTAAEWFGRKISERLLSTDADGIEFDVGRWTFGNSKLNPMDANNDGITDFGYIDGVNSFGLGGQVFFRELRQRIGNDKIIQVDSNDAIYGVRGWKYLNGIQMESFPAANDFDQFSPAFLHLRLWSENVEQLPKISYPLTKTPTTVYNNARLANGGNTDFRFRVGLASSCLVGMPHSFATMNVLKVDPANPSGTDLEKSETFGAFMWDEYHGGELNNWHWLGKPVSLASQDLSNLDKTDILAKANWQWSISSGFSAKHNETPNLFSANVQTIPSGIFPEKTWEGVNLSLKDGGIKSLESGREYTLEFEARGDDTWNYAGQTFDHVPRMVTINGAITSNGNKPFSVLVDNQWRTYKISFIADSSRKPTPVFGISEQVGATEIRNIKLYSGGAERWLREFEKGVVLLNMTNSPWQAPIKKGYYRHLKGSQDPDVNNGQLVDNTIVVPARDAVFLVKR